MSAGTTTATSISLSWTNGGSEGVSYEVEWWSASQCPDNERDQITVSSTSYVIMGLEESIRYRISVIASNEVSSAFSEIVTMTLETGIRSVILPDALKFGLLSLSSSLWSSYSS